MTQTPDERQQLRQRLAQDHARLDAIFDELLAALRADAREEVLRLWTLFDDGLSRHMALEERYLLPELSRDEPREAARITRDHADMRVQLAELGMGIDQHRVPPQLVLEFIDRLRQHAWHEDAIAYRWTEGDGLSNAARQEIEAGLDRHDSLRRRLVEMSKQARARVRER